MRTDADCIGDEAVNADAVAAAAAFRSSQQVLLPTSYDGCIIVVVISQAIREDSWIERASEQSKDLLHGHSLSQPCNALVGQAEGRLIGPVLGLNQELLGLHIARRLIYLTHIANCCFSASRWTPSARRWSSSDRRQRRFRR